MYVLIHQIDRQHFVCSQHRKWLGDQNLLAREKTLVKVEADNGK